MAAHGPKRMGAKPANRTTPATLEPAGKEAQTQTHRAAVQLARKARRAGHVGIHSPIATAPRSLGAKPISAGTLPIAVIVGSPAMAFAREGFVMRANSSSMRPR